MIFNVDFSDIGKLRRTNNGKYYQYKGKIRTSTSVEYTSPFASWIGIKIELENIGYDVHPLLKILNSLGYMDLNRLLDKKIEISTIAYFLINSNGEVTVTTNIEPYKDYGIATHEVGISIFMLDYETFMVYNERYLENANN